MLGMHGTVAANAAVDGADLLLAVGVRFDDRVTGKLEAFAARARIVHIDIDPAEIGKNKHAHVALTAEARPALEGINALLEASPIEGDPYAEWRKELAAVAAEYPLSYPDRGDVIVPQRAIEVLHEETKGEAIVSTVRREEREKRERDGRGAEVGKNNKKNSKKKQTHSLFFSRSSSFLPPPPPSPLIPLPSPPFLKPKQPINQGVGQHQMWAAQWYKFDEPRRWVTSGGLGAMGFGLPPPWGPRRPTTATAPTGPSVPSSTSTATAPLS